MTSLHTYLDGTSGYLSLFQSDRIPSDVTTEHSGVAIVGTSFPWDSTDNAPDATTFATNLSVSDFQAAAATELNGSGPNSTSTGGADDPQFDSMVTSALSTSTFRSDATDKNLILWVDLPAGSLSQTSKDLVTTTGARLSVVTSNVFTSGKGIALVTRVNGSLVAYDVNGKQISGVTESDILILSADKEAILASGGFIGDLNVSATNPTGFSKAVECAVSDLFGVTCTTGDTTESIISETSRVTVRAVARQVASAIQNRVRAVSGGNVLQAMRSGKSTGLNAGDGVSIPIGIWVDTTYSSLDNSSASQAFDGDTKTGLMGVDATPMENLVVGVAIGVETTNLDLSSVNGSKDTDGISGFIYGGYKFNQYVSLDALVGYGSFSTDIADQSSGARVTGDDDSSRYLATLNLNGTYQYDQVLFTGTLGYLFTQENPDSYTASDGSTVNPDTTNLGQGIIGLEIGYLFDRVYPYVRGALERDFVTESGADSTGGNIGAGVLFSPVDNLTLGANTSYDIGRKDEENFSIGLNARYQF